MKKLLVTVLIATLLPLNSFAKCTQPATKLVKGQKSPCTGVLFSPEKEKQIRVDKEKNKITLEQLGIQNNIIKIYRKDSKEIESIIDKESQKAELWRNAAEESTQKLIKSESGRGKRDWLFFVLGILTTGVAAYGLSKVKR